MSELKAISGHEIREDIDYNTRGVDHDDKEWRNYGKELCETLYYRKFEVDKMITDLEESHKMEVGQLLIEIAELKEKRRWRKFSEEKPKEKQWVLVFVENPSIYGTYIELRRWDVGLQFDVENQELYIKWLPLPSAPKEEK